MRKEKPISEMSKIIKALTFGKGVILNRWMVVVASFFVMICAGGVYSFGIYSQALKLALGYNQETLNTLSFFKDLGTDVGILGGTLYDSTGPPLVFGTGAALNVTGYLMIWMAVTERIARPEVWHMCLYFLMASSWTAFINTACIVTCIKNFPLSRGIVMGLLKGSLVILTENFSKVSKSINQVLSAVMFFILLLPLWVVLREEAKSMESIETAAPDISLQIAASQHAEARDLEANCNKYKPELNDREHSHVTDFKEEAQTSECGVSNNKQEKLHPSTSQQDSLFSNDNENEKTASKTSGQRSHSYLQKGVKYITEAQRATDLTPAQALFNINLWTLFIASTCGIGCMLTVIDNLGQIGTSLGYSPSNITTCVSLLSISNFLGRVASGFVSESLLQRRGVPRPVLFVFVLIVACVGHLILVFNLPAAPYAGSVIIGLCFGASFTLIFTIVSEICGLRFFATIFNCLQLCSPLGLYLISVRTAGVLYDREAKQEIAASSNMQHLVVNLQKLQLSPAPAPLALYASEANLLCNGSHCYQTAFSL
ncbi:hypothetical protein O6H91_16G071800 [Diphasiastrum complanatum]|uniref:Uncharacterized protein n=1 Tax=Diphasiastrum complanatum TaxID=34168 RepID=A0ACC2BDH4_DIPCM|nr:hypothetical protein O6H91_16G071800 [Diphasiastrum complanatum]